MGIFLLTPVQCGGWRSEAGWGSRFLPPWGPVGSRQGTQFSYWAGLTPSQPRPLKRPLNNGWELGICLPTLHWIYLLFPCLGVWENCPEWHHRDQPEQQLPDLSPSCAASLQVSLWGQMLTKTSMTQPWGLDLECEGTLPGERARREKMLDLPPCTRKLAFQCYL